MPDKPVTKSDIDERIDELELFILQGDIGAALDWCSMVRQMMYATILVDVDRKIDELEKPIIVISTPRNGKGSEW